MAFSKHNFKDGETLRAQQLNEMEDAIAEALEAVENSVSRDDLNAATEGLYTTIGETREILIIEIEELRDEILGVAEELKMVNDGGVE